MFSAEVERLRNTFNAHKTQSIAWRKSQLQCLLQMLKENKDAICDARQKDLRRLPAETEITELLCLQNDIVDMLADLDELVKPEKCKRSLLAATNSVQIHKQPYGVVLIIGAWNFPFLLTLQPLVGAIAAGNCVVIKPPEMAQASGDLMKQLIEKYLDPECFSVVIAGPKESSDLVNNHRFDLIFYTGGSSVGKIIMQAAAKHLTPVILELGGKNPCFVDSSCDLNTAAKRIAWGKWSNAGQACVAPDFILCEANIRAPLIDLLKQKLEELYGKDPRECEFYNQIVNERHVKRLRGLLEGVDVVHGGLIDESARYFSPTIVTNIREDAPIQKEEVFGPILPIHVVDDVDDAIRFINEGGKSLEMSIFAKDRRVIDKIVAQTTSGGVTVNDLLIQYSEPALPFGGVGSSGMGCYHGKHSFEAFTHKRSYYESFTPEMFNNLRYPPYSNRKLSLLRPLLFKSGPFSSTTKACFKLAFLSSLGVMIAYLYSILYRSA